MQGLRNGSAWRGAVWARLRHEAPFLALGAAAVVAPFVVLGQGGDWPTALWACPATLAVPSCAIEATLGLARLGLWIEGGGSPPGR